MKIAVITDTHFGARNGALAIHGNQKHFFEEQFLPYLKKHNITHVIHGGDLFDNRKSQDVRIADEWKEIFQQTLDEGIAWSIIIGNHDTYFKNTNLINSVELCMPKHENFHVYTGATNINIEGLDICLIPWINDENYQETIEVINSSKATLCIGHLELVGFEYQKNQIATHGYEANLFSKFNKVLSGHYHKRSNKGNIYYLGTPYENTWNEANESLGFHTIDENLNLTFIENHVKLFNTIYYDELNQPKLTKKLITGKFIKLIIDNRTNLYNYDTWLEKLIKLQPANLNIIEPELIKVLNGDSLEFKVKNDNELIEAYVNNHTEFHDKQKLVSFLIGLLNRTNEERRTI